jgi:glycosyltransferase involved in cell wall biosynthesis
MQAVILDLLSIVPYYTGYLSRDLARQGVDVRLASVTYHLDPGWFDSIGVANRAGVDTARWFRPESPAIRQPLKLAEYLLNLFLLAVKIIFARPDVLHVQFLPLVPRGLPFEIWVLRLARARGVRIVYTVHNVLPHDSSAALRERYQTLYRFADQLIAHDEHARKKLGDEFGIPAAKVKVIPHGPLFDEPPAAGSAARERERLGIAADACIVVCQGIIRPYKGIPFLLDAWTKVVREHPTAVLRIAGTGDDDLLAGIRQRVQELGLEKSVLLDLRFLTVDEVRACLDSADVLAYPYKDITTSGALLTGVNYGKAVVATSLPAFELLLENERNSLMVPYGDTDRLAEALGRLIGDQRLREQLGDELAQAEFRSTGWKEIAAATRQCYEGRG